MAYRLLHAVRTQGPIARPRSATRTSQTAAWSGSCLPRNLLSSGSLYAEFCCPNTTSRAVRREGEYQPDQPRSETTRGEQPFQERGAGKKTAAQASPPSQEEWQEGAGSLRRLSRSWKPLSLQGSSLLLPHCVLRAFNQRPCAASCSPCSCLQAVGLRRTWDLRGYSGQALALLTNRRLAYGYRHIEHFLAELARVGADEALTQALAGWTASLWKRQPALEDRPVPVYYIDGQTPRRLHRFASFPVGW